MKKQIAYLLLLTGSFALLAQETVLWGAQVIDISSEYGALEYSAMQALHKPNVLPGGGDNPNAWRPKNQNREEFIMVAFEKPIRAKQVAIAESENPGAIKKVFAYDVDYNEYLLFELTPRAIPLKSRLLNLFFETTKYEIQAIRVVLDCATVPGFNAIDAIGISASNIPINVLMSLAKGINQELPADAMGANVNSESNEHGPILSPDGKRLYFSRQYHPGNIGGADDPEDIWVSELDEKTGEWLPAKNVGPPLNTAGPNFISSISIVDGKEVIILGNRYGKKGRMYQGASMSVRTGDSFSEPIPLEIDNDYNYANNADYFLVPGGKALIISAERDDTYGLRDLYVSFRKNDGTWGEPKNLGSDINTLGDEESAFLAANGKTLYFSSNGYTGYGGKDIFVSVRLDDSWRKWSTPENMGAGVNSAGDDEYFSIPAVGQHAFFTRGDANQNMDIYMFKVDDLFTVREGPVYESMKHLTTDQPDKPDKPEIVEVIITVSGRVVDKSTGKAVPNAKIIIERLPDGLQIGTTTSDVNGNYQFRVRPGARYGVITEKDGYLSQDENFDFNTVTQSTAITKELNVVPLEKGASVVFNNIFFDFDKSDLRTSSYPELNRVLELMQANKIQKISITGHTDDIGDDDYNQALSERRAKAVYDFFIKNGIAKERLSSKGLGESKPAVPNTSADNRGKNRRVEFEIQ
jgi:OmpA-OmpF porin, OOP family